MIEVSTIEQSNFYATHAIKKELKEKFLDI